MRYHDINILYTKRFLTTAEIFDEIVKIEREENFPDNIYILPPNDDGKENHSNNGDED